MATHDVDQRMLGRLAKSTATWSPIVSSHLFRILGLSIILTKHMNNVGPRSNTDEPAALVTCYHIIFLAREGLSFVETFILPYAETDGASAELRVFAAKLRASFYHIFCLYRNSPTVQFSKSPLSRGSSRSSATATVRDANPLSPSTGNIQGRTPSPSPGPTPPTLGKSFETPSKSADDNDKENPSKYQQLSGSSSSGRKRQSSEYPATSPRNSQPQTRTITPPRRRKTPFLRDPVLSGGSDASFITNPYALAASAQRRSLHAGNTERRHSYLRDAIPSMLSDTSYVTNPYAALGPRTTTPNFARPLPPLSPVHSPARFLLPSLNYVPPTLQFFSRASALARLHLRGTSALRLSVAAEYADFLGECLGDWDGGREIARRAVQENHRAREEMGMVVEDYDDAAPFVASLVRLADKGKRRQISPVRE